MNLLDTAVRNKLISFNEDRTVIHYIDQNITRNFKNPEEEIQAETYCKLILEYNYPVKHIRQFVKVTVGSDSKEADMIIYKDDRQDQPYIIVECKRSEVTEQEFKQAVNQAYAYAFATAGTVKYIWVNSGIKSEYFMVDKESSYKELTADIPQYGVDSLPEFKFAKNGGFTKDGQKLFPLFKVEESELTNKFKQAHQALWGGGELNPSEAFDELDKLIFCKIFDEKKRRRNGEPYDFQIIKVQPSDKSEEAKRKADDETSLQLRKRLVTLYEEGKESGERKDDTEIFREGIKLNAQKVRTVVGYLEGVDLMGSDLDSKGRAFETFMGSFFRGDFGQYFTPRKIVNFVVESLPITEKHRVLDTSCGSGGFLLLTLDKVRKAIRAFFDIPAKEPDTQECIDAWQEFAKYNLYGIEINEQIARTAKMNMIIHNDGHTNIVVSDGLVSPEELRKKTGNRRFKDHSFHFIITNPPFGSTIKQTEKAYLHQYQMAVKEIDWLNPMLSEKQKSKRSQRPSQSTEVLFIEQAEHYLRDGGYLAIVLPDGILTNSSMQYVRDYISESFRIVAVVSMPQTAFMANGAGVKSSVLFLRKYPKKEKQVRIDEKVKLQEQLIGESLEGRELKSLMEERREKISNILKQIKIAEKEGNLPKAEELKLLKQNIADELDKKMEEVREKLTELYGKQYKDNVVDYPIFMAIAEEIGYDATGKETGKNDLEKIAVRLNEFITAIERGEDHFFA